MQFKERTVTSNDKGFIQWAVEAFRNKKNHIFCRFVKITFLLVNINTHFIQHRRKPQACSRILNLFMILFYKMNSYSKNKVSQNIHGHSSSNKPKQLKQQRLYIK